MSFFSISCNKFNSPKIFSEISFFFLTFNFTRWYSIVFFFTYLYDYSFFLLNMMCINPSSLLLLPFKNMEKSGYSSKTNYALRYFSSKILYLKLMFWILMRYFVSLFKALFFHWHLNRAHMLETISYVLIIVFIFCLWVNL